MLADEILGASPPFVHFATTASWARALEALRGPDAHVAEIDLASGPDKPALLASISDALGFAAHFGHNWDALLDALRDLDGIDTPVCVLALRGAASWWQAHDAVAGTLVACWLDAADFRAAQGRALHLVLVD